TKFLSGADNLKKPFALFVSYINPHDIYHMRPGTNDVSGKKIPLPPSWAKQDFESVPVVQYRFMTEDQGKRLWGLEQRYWEEYRDYYREQVRLYDSQLGTVLQKLREKNLYEESVILASSDHGDMDAAHKLIYKGPFMYENMVKIPLVIRVPEKFGGIGPRTESLLTPNVDLVPTLLDYAGISGYECDGQSLRGALTGRGRAPNREYVIGQYYSKQEWINPIRMIRTRDWKYNRYRVWGEELYDLKDDPEETMNLASQSDHKKVKDELNDLLQNWMRENEDPFESYGISTRGGVRLIPWKG
ncbi:MAG: sulfatase-like hydrolase/transferase, partial [Candidatus Omnitrophica bacterium]|nr:sulfatase-like hydrolase/transferase [Candidatus Omnitrophota bacterium]